MLRIAQILTPPSFGGPVFGRAVHFRAPTFSSSELWSQRKVNTDSEVIEVTKMGIVFSAYMIWCISGYIVLCTKLCRNLENQILRMGTERIWIRLIVTIPAIVGRSQGASEQPTIYSFGWVSEWLPRRGVAERRTHGRHQQTKVRPTGDRWPRRWGRMPLRAICQGCVDNNGG